MGAPQIFENLIQAKRLHSLSAAAPRIQVQNIRFQTAESRALEDKVLETALYLARTVFQCCRTYD
ncbi:hypothetical protein A7E75_02160 [Syntrophotalea acetylenica]|uniref:Uncharacterized protein n=1 Tax=Syntrophotalea acetylenica TaxID=29542 RepID=A0A1L3GDI1_SYNAC|nr:hypothetical protein A7E75_02160 [Syntrophotalea acetylenica]